MQSITGCLYTSTEFLGSIKAHMGNVTSATIPNYLSLDGYICIYTNNPWNETKESSFFVCYSFYFNVTYFEVSFGNLTMSSLPKYRPLPLIVLVILHYKFSKDRPEYMILQCNQIYFRYTDVTRYTIIWVNDLIQKKNTCSFYISNAFSQLSLSVA